MKYWWRLVGAALIVTLWSIPNAVELGAAEQNARQQIVAKIEKDKVIVTVGGKLFTCYKFSASQKYPYFWPVNGPASGKSITTETSQPYPHHHSLFFGCDRVNGGNYWQEGNERGQIVSQGPKLIEASGDRVVFIDKCLWRQPGKEPIIHDLRRIVITAPSESLRIIDFEIRLKPLTDIRILKSNHALFSARLVPELSVKSGGTLVNAEGKTGEKETWGVPSPWCDYSGRRDGIIEGVAILQHPKNRWFPAKWFTRDYGFFSPTPMNWLKDGRLEMAKGEILTLRYRVVVHNGDTKAAGIKGLFEQYKKTEKALNPSSPSPKATDRRAGVDLRPIFKKWGLEPKKQGMRNTCSVFATTWALEFALSKQLNKSTPLSVEYLNWACNNVINNRTANRGQFFHHLLKGFEQYGICPEQDMPYAQQFDPQYSPSTKARAQAKNIQASGLTIHWINPWKKQAGLTDSHISQIKAILDKGWPVAVGSSHSRLLVGYRNDTRQPGGGAFIAKDSRPGTYTEITYEFVKKKVGDVFWVES
ncbi:MAG: hypothetical protein FVQ85_09525 [Planctomycetes bacterium]|nr:hypothetical protein [Planctomycetota bacterium]